MKKILSLCAVLVLVGCSNIPIENQLMAGKATLTTLQTGAYDYVDQPLCGSPEAVGAVICSRPTYIAKIQMADNAATTAFDAAYKIKDETSLAAFQTSLTAIQKIINDILAGR